MEEDGEGYCRFCGAVSAGCVAVEEIDLLSVELGCMLLCLSCDRCQHMPTCINGSRELVKAADEYRLYLPFVNVDLTEIFWHTIVESSQFGISLALFGYLCMSPIRAYNCSMIEY